MPIKVHKIIDLKTLPGAGAMVQYLRALVALAEKELSLTSQNPSGSLQPFRTFVLRNLISLSHL